jgi:hypothetical protein
MFAKQKPRSSSGGVSFQERGGAGILNFDEFPTQYFRLKRFLGNEHHIRQKQELGPAQAGLSQSAEP